MRTVRKCFNIPVLTQAHHPISCAICIVDSFKSLEYRWHLSLKLCSNGSELADDPRENVMRSAGSNLNVSLRVYEFPCTHATETASYFPR
jgi:hypothetical protein